MEPTLIPIGKAADLCSVSTRTLRFYEKNGLIRPDYVGQDNRYRYYSYGTLQRVQTIRYLLHVGFSLSEIREMLQNDNLDSMQTHFNGQITETEAEIRRLQLRLSSLNAWRSLLQEGEHVLKQRERTVRTRHLPEQSCFSFTHQPASEEEQTAAFTATAYYARSKESGNEMIDIGGPINVHFDSFAERMSGHVRQMTLLQTLFPGSETDAGTISFGGFLAAACYHIGSHANISETYDTIIRWCGEYNYELRGDSLERNVLDEYSIRDENRFVTEILLPIAE